MEVDSVADVLEWLVRADRAIDADSLAGYLGSSGWESAGTPVQSVPRKWSHGALRASVYSEGSEDFLEFAFKVIPPDWDVPEYANAVDSEYVEEVRRVRDLSERIIALLGERGITANLVSSEDREIDVDFIEKFSWNVGGKFLTAGVAHPDEDAPILLIARVRDR